MAASSRPTAVARSAALDGLWLDAKLTIPQVKPGFVSRSSIVDAARGSDRPIVAVSAPAGYGKSVLLSQWASIETRAVGWASLDRFDDDPATLLALLAAAFVRATGADRSLVATMSRHRDSSLGRAAPTLAAALRSSPTPFMIAIDDLHELSSPACQDVLGVVVRGVPPGSQLVTAGRSQPTFLPRTRALGDAWEIGADDLALDADAAQRIFAAADLRLDEEHARALIVKTEGWPVGLYLASLVARGASNDAAARPVETASPDGDALAGDDPFVADYLYREALIGVSAKGLRFLRCVAVLERLCAELCDAVVGEPGSQAMLQELAAAGLFLTPLDRHRRWFRLHPLFRDFLLGELRRLEPDAAAELHRRAAAWHEESGLPSMAVEHLLQTPDRDRCARLVTRLAPATYQAGHLDTVRRWLTALGDDAIVGCPPLTVLAGWLAVVSGHAVDADRWAARAESLHFDDVPDDGSASFRSSRAMLRSIMCAGGPLRAHEDALTGVDEEPSWSPWRPQALLILAEADLLIGRRDAAAAGFAEAADLAPATGSHNVRVVAEAELALLAMEGDRWVEAAGRLGNAFDTIRRHHLEDNATSALAYAASTELVRHRGDAHPERAFAAAMRSRQYCTIASPALAVRARLILARSHLAVGDASMAYHLLREIDDILLRRPALGTLTADVARFRERLDTSRSATTDGPPLTPAELRLLPYLQTHLMITEIGERLHISRNTVSTEVRSIYRKLGVASRSEAVRCATERGLLGR